MTTSVVSPYRATTDVDPAELALTPARGWMVISEDNKNGPAEAQLLKLSVQ